MTTRLRSLTEAECYARCYGGLRDDTVRIVKLPPRRARFDTGEEIRLLFEERLDGREPGQAVEVAA